MLCLDSTDSGFQHVLPAFYFHDEAITQEVAHESLRLAEKQPVPPALYSAQEAFDPAAAYAARSAFLRKMVVVLGRIIGISAPLLPRPETLLDYEAWIRHMVRIDDVIEASWAEASALRLPGRGGRVTRNSQKYERWISLAPDMRALLAVTALQG